MNQANGCGEEVPGVVAEKTNIVEYPNKKYRSGPELGVNLFCGQQLVEDDSMRFLSRDGIGLPDPSPTV